MAQPNRSRRHRPRTHTLSQDRPKAEETQSKSLEDLIRRFRHEIVRLAASDEIIAQLSTVSLELSIDVPVGKTDPSALKRAAAKLGDQMADQVRHQALLRARIRPGRVLCLRCDHSECEHSVPSTSSAVFSGYEPSGRPQWLEFNTRLTERSDGRVDRLFAERPSVLARVASGRELSKRLLPAFAEGLNGCQLLGQVEAGWIPTGPQRTDSRFAACFQLYRLGQEGQALKLQLNPVALLPGGESLESKLSSGEMIGLSSVLALTRATLDGMARQYGRRVIVAGRLEEESMTVLRDLARDLEASYRNQNRRTRHGRERSRSSERPTTKAFNDAIEVSDDGIRFDVREKTFIVLGKQQRVHVFSLLGRHITSVTYPTETIRARSLSGRWRACTPEEAASFRRSLDDKN